MPVSTNGSSLRIPLEIASWVWHQRNAYDPGWRRCYFDIYRTHYNYLESDDDKKTPAMRLGLAKGKVRLTEILTF